ncbi:MAG: FAD-dependent oxidoreductase [Candidatus Aminicenantes bacterium]|nr:FAD-dependent oxidoreductase [Candidatus Aminicenantes bacterium]
MKNKQGAGEIAVLGGGITGLALAYYLTRAGRPVTLFEKENNIGGLAGAFEVNGISIDKYYRHIFPCHSEILETIEALGLQQLLIFKKASMGYFSGGEIFRLDSLLDMLRFKPLNLWERFRVGLSASPFFFKKDWQSFDSLSAEDYLVQRCGGQGFKIFWEPLLRNKFGRFSSAVSAAWLQDRLLSRKGSGLMKSSGRLGYLAGGFQALFKGMAEEIEKHGGRIMTGCPIARIETAGDRGGSFFILNGDAGLKYRTCIVTLPLPLFGEICPDLPADYRSRLAAVDYAHSICMVLRLREPLGSFYWLNIGDASFPFAVVVEHTNWMDRKYYGNQAVVYLSQYVTGAADSDRQTPDNRLFERYCGYLGKIFPHFRRSQVIGFHVWRDMYTQPIFKTHYARRVLPFAAPFKNLFLVDSSQFYPDSRCMNTSFILAKRFIETAG